MNRFFPLISFTLVHSWLGSLPTNPQVLSGEALFTLKQAGTLEIQVSDRAAIDWKDFSIGAQETARFIQPSKASVVINQVMGGDLSSLLGRLEANGGVYLINPNGILFGEECVVDTGSFLGTTFPEVSDLCFKGDSEASIINRGTILARDGDAVLIGYAVENQGAIEAPAGSALLGAGREIVLQPSAREKLYVKPGSAKAYGEGISNSGQIAALRAELHADGNLYALALSHSGAIDALGVEERGGEVFLVADGGKTEVSGSISAMRGEWGGTIDLLGAEVDLTGSAQIDASAPKGGGYIRVGGDLYGQNPSIRNASITRVGPQVSINADAAREGNGGTVAVWSDGTTVFNGTISARGGINGGNGGFIETSGKRGLVCQTGLAATLSPAGKAGTWLLDPDTITVMAGGGCTLVTATDCMAGGACVIDPITITTGLGLGDVTLCANTGAGTITVASGAVVSWMSGNLLTLTASNSVTFLATVESTAVGIPDSQVVLSVNAPLVTIGDAGHAAVDITVGTSRTLPATTGRVEIAAPTALTVYGGGSMMGGGSYIHGVEVGLSGGNFTLLAGPGMFDGSGVGVESAYDCSFTGDFAMISQGGGTGISGNSMIPAIVDGTIDVGGNLTMAGGSGPTAACALIFWGGGTLNASVGGTMSMMGGTSTGDGNCAVIANGGTFVIQLSAGNLFLTGGSGLGMGATNFAVMGGPAGSVDITVPGSIVLQGGSSDSGTAGAFIRCADDMMPLDGDVSITAGTLSIIGGTVNNDPAAIGSDRNLIIQVAGDMSLSSHAASGAGFALMRTGDGPSPGFFDIHVGGNLSLNAQGSLCALQCNLPNSTLLVSAANLSIVSMSSESAFIGVTSGAIDIAASGDISIAAGNAAPMMGRSFAGIGGSFLPMTATAITLSAQNYTITGGAGDACAAGIVLGDIFSIMPGGGGGSINATAAGTTGIRLTGGAGTDSPAAIEIRGDVGSITFTSPNPSSSLLLTGTTSEARIATQFGGPIIDPVGGSIILDGAASIIVGPGPVSQLLLIAGSNIELRSALSSIENQSGGDLTLVVDNNFPNPFLFGSGFFSSAAGSAVFTNDGMTDGLLRIFSSQQNLNQINGNLNGIAFARGTLFTNTATEQWQTWYPSAFGGVPYTVFYKNSEQLLAQQALTIVDQLLFGLHPLNEYPGWMMEFSMSYASASGAYSSLQESASEPYYLRRRHLKFINHPKSYTVLME